MPLIDKGTQTEEPAPYYDDHRPLDPQTPARASLQNSAFSLVSMHPFPFFMPTLWIPTPFTTPQNNPQRMVYIPPPVVAHNPNQHFQPIATPSSQQRSHLTGQQEPGHSHVREKRKWRTVQDKVNELLQLIQSFNWTLGDMLYHTFSMRDHKGELYKPDPIHYQMVSKFLSGGSDATAGIILEIWFNSPYGKPPNTHIESMQKFSTEHPFQSIHFAHPSISAFAAQLVRRKVRKEAEKATWKDGGLHTFTSRARSSDDAELRHDLGAQIFPETMATLEENMPLTWELLMTIAALDEKARERERRPPRMVRMMCICS